MTMSQDADKPSLHHFDIAKTRTRTICLEECLLRQLFRVGPRTGPPVRDSEEESLVLPYPVIEHLITDLHDALSLGLLGLPSQMEWLLHPGLFQGASTFSES